MRERLGSLLADPPRIIRIGKGIHGTRRREKYHFSDYFCLHLYHYPLNLEIDGGLNSIEPGSLSLVPAHAQMVFHFDQANCEHDYAIFELGESTPEEIAPLIVGPGLVPAGFGETFRLAAEEHHQRPDRARCILWHLLWMLMSEPCPPRSNRDPLVDQVVDHLNRRLNLPLSVSAIASFFGVSHNHLTRKFQAAFGQGVAAFICDRRIELACHLLENSTLPIKIVAQECGIPDAHAFNKAFRRTRGCSPSSYRESNWNR